ncbi:MAG: ATP-binding protein [Clostridia bacterium]|nr:ATP-binding protein [Clostridia bacterium]
MRNWNVSVDNNSFDSAGITKDCQEAICEYIWNGFEAQATRVEVDISGGNVQEAPVIRIKDNGTGINHTTLENTFGAFLSSQKRSKALRLKSQANKGKGRFSYSAIASEATWDTTFAGDEGLYQYTIQLSSLNKANVRESDVIDVSAEDHQTGTIVSIPIVDGRINYLLCYENMRAKLLEEFAWYLYLNRDSQAELVYCGNTLDYDDYIDSNLSHQVEITIDEHKFVIDVVVWKNRVKNNSKIYYINSEGAITNAENTSFNKNTVDFYHAVFVRSKYFSNLPILIGAEDESLIEYATGQKEIMRKLNKQIRMMLNLSLRDFLLARADAYLEKLGDKDQLPYFSDDDFGRSKKKDFMGVTRELYCTEPRIFHKLKPRQTKSLLGFLALLLDSNERENVLSVVEQIVTLTAEQRKKFAEILKRTKLEHIIDMVDVIQKRFEVVSELKRIVYDPVTSRFANERDHIQKLVEQHFWLFGDQYAMVTADVTFKRSLASFEEKLGIPKEESSQLTPEELRQRMDIFLYGSRVNEVNVKEGLVIELKAPSVSLDQVVLSQIERYANMIRKEPQFSGVNRAWRFFAICSSVDDDVQSKYDGYKAHGKFGLVSIVGNFEIYAITWDDVFLNFEQRHRFLLEKIQKDFEQTEEIDDDESIDRQYVNEKVKHLLTFNLS